jgi:hypothetical protein
MIARSRVESNAYSSARQSLSISRGENSRAMGSRIAFSRDAPMRSQKTSNCRAVTFDSRDATA